jgi:hypothetical protein
LNQKVALHGIPLLCFCQQIIRTIGPLLQIDSSLDKCLIGRIDKAALKERIGSALPALSTEGYLSFNLACLFPRYGWSMSHAWNDITLENSAAMVSDQLQCILPKWICNCLHMSLMLLPSLGSFPSKRATARCAVGGVEILPLPIRRYLLENQYLASRSLSAQNPPAPHF